MSIIRKIIFIRHGECSSNIQPYFQSVGDCLTNTGIAQAKRRGPLLENIVFDRIYSSTATRTLQTLLYAVSYGLKIPKDCVISPLLLEIDRGEYAGTLETPESRSYINMITNTITEAPPGGESVMDVRNRVQLFREQLLASNDTMILIVGHSGRLKYFTAQLYDQTIQEALQAPSINHTEMCTIILEDNNCKMIERG